MWAKMNYSQENAFHAGLWEPERVSERPDGIYYFIVVL